MYYIYPEISGLTGFSCEKAIKQITFLKNKKL